jgi:hypothetical protein
VGVSVGLGVEVTGWGVGVGRGDVGVGLGLSVAGLDSWVGLGVAVESGAGVGPAGLSVVGVTLVRDGSSPCLGAGGGEVVSFGSPSSASSSMLLKITVGVDAVRFVL